ncbi:MAG: cupin domain-containing protein [Candidatus Peribacteraceae bacterium]|nr:cupin domain-containing protein [Candidatus Peribacteraceae bacterium]
MNGYITNIEDATRENSFFRKVLYTAKHSQLVVMSLLPGEEIGEEVHALDQFIRIEEGTGKAILNGKESPLVDGSAVVIPSGVRHNIVNTGGQPMKLYTVYSPPEHLDGTVHRTRKDVPEHEEEFDGKTTEK